MTKKKTEEYLTPASKKENFTVQTDKTFPNLKNVSGDSVDEHKELEEANSFIGGKEIGQQNENL